METIERPIYSIQRLPRWVKRNAYDLTNESMYADSPHFYLLVDYQKQVKDREIRSYYRSVQKINALSRIEDASLFMSDLRAGNESLVYHRMDVLRNGRRLSALNADNIRVYQRENSLRKHITNHRLTVCHSMDDLRVGDIIDIQTTLVEWANDHPAAVKHNLGLFWLDWNCRVLKQNIRIINRSSRSLNLHQHVIEDGREFDSYAVLKPKQECERQYSELMPKSISGTAPEWLYTDFLQVTPDTSWARISREFHRIYADAARCDSDIDCSEIDRIELTGIQQVDAMRMIRFVQNEIRYLSECDGIYSHTPRPPRYTLRRGAGDCKGKSNLLVVLLRSIGVEANPALVHSSTGKAIGSYKPSACHFNHVILRVFIAGKHYYFDPTLQHQAGDFKNAAQLEYGFVLNLTAAGEDLVELPFDLSRKAFEIRHCLNFRDNDKGNGTVTITRRYFARQADKMRAYIASNETREVARNYFESAQDDINLDLAVVKAFTVMQDDTSRNIMITREQYKFSAMDADHGEGDVIVTTNFHHGFPFVDDGRFELQTIADGGLEHFIVVLYPSAINEEARDWGFANPNFSYRNKVWSEGRKLISHTQVTPLREVVEHADIERYDNDARRLYRHRDNSLPRQYDDDSVIWESIAAVLLFGALATTIIGLLYYQ